MLQSLIAGEDNERKRVSIEIHDSLGQNLTAANLNFNSLKQLIQKLEGKDSIKCNTGLEFLKSAIEESRNITHNLIPKAMDDFGLIPSLMSLFNQIKKSTGIDVKFYENLGKGSLNRQIELNLYWITQEAINNLIKRSGATKVDIQLVLHKQEIIYACEDNGIGFEKSSIEIAERGMSLKSIFNSVVAMSGGIDLDTTPKSGSSITIEIAIQYVMDITEKIEVLLVDVHKIVRDGVKVLLQDASDIKVVAEAENGKHALEKLTEFMPDLMIIDINMPVMKDIDCSREVVKKYPLVKILALTMLNEQEHIKNMIAVGAGGYVLKTSGLEELVEAIKTVSSVKNYFSNEVKNIIMMNMVKKKLRVGKISGERIPLTSREKDVLEYIVKEFTNQEIAEKLFISVRTVDTHRRNLLEKAGSRNTAGPVKYVIENNLNSLEES